MDAIERSKNSEFCGSDKKTNFVRQFWWLWFNLFICMLRVSSVTKRFKTSKKVGKNLRWSRVSSYRTHVEAPLGTPSLNYRNLSDQWIWGKNHEYFENHLSWNFEITHFLRGFSKKTLGLEILKLPISQGVFEENPWSWNFEITHFLRGFWENDTEFTTFWNEN